MRTFLRVIGSNTTGSGIGLAIVREIPVRHGATVAVATPLGGRGSQFRVNFSLGASAKALKTSTY